MAQAGENQQKCFKNLTMTISDWNTDNYYSVVSNTQQQQTHNVSFNVWSMKAAGVMLFCEFSLRLLVCSLKY